MKKTVLICCITAFFILIMTSCSTNHSKDVYFIHAASFIRENDGITMYAAAQKQQEKNEDKYFLASASGKNIKDAVEKMSDKYSECYFATNEVFVFGKDDISDGEFLKELSYICENPFVPSVSRVTVSEKDDVKKILKSIEKEDDLKKLLKKTDKNKLAFAGFVGTALSQTENKKIPLVALDKDGKPKVIDSITVGANMLSKKGER